MQALPRRAPREQASMRGRSVRSDSRTRGTQVRILTFDAAAHQPVNYKLVLVVLLVLVPGNVCQRWCLQIVLLLAKHMVVTVAV